MFHWRMMTGLLCLAAAFSHSDAYANASDGDIMLAGAPAPIYVPQLTSPPQWQIVPSLPQNCLPGYGGVPTSYIENPAWTACRYSCDQNANSDAMYCNLLDAGVSTDSMQDDSSAGLCRINAQTRLDLCLSQCDGAYPRQIPAPKPPRSC